MNLKIGVARLNSLIQPKIIFDKKKQPTITLEIDNHNSEPELRANQNSDDGDFSNRFIVKSPEVCVTTSDVFEDL